jgi:alcohol dehydrogenase class IV
MREFANWSTGNVAGGGPLTNGDSYWNKITDTYKKFEKSHTMPMRLREDGVTEQTWETSKWAKAVAHINKCNANPADPACIWMDIPRGDENPPAPQR